MYLVTTYSLLLPGGQVLQHFFAAVILPRPGCGWVSEEASQVIGHGRLLI